MPPDPPGRLERDGQARRGAARSHEFNPNSLQVSLVEIARPSYGDASTVTRALEEGWRRALRHAAADGSITHEEEVGIANQVMLISSAVSHALAWIAYLVVTFGLVLWPAWQDGDGQDLIVLATVFAPVALSGLGLLTVLDQGRLVDSNPMSIIFAVLLTLFCGLAIFSIVLIHLPPTSRRLRRFKGESGLSWSEISRRLGTYRTPYGVGGRPGCGPERGAAAEEAGLPSGLVKPSAGVGDSLNLALVLS